MSIVVCPSRRALSSPNPASLCTRSLAPPRWWPRAAASLASRRRGRIGAGSSATSEEACHQGVGGPARRGQPGRMRTGARWAAGEDEGHHGGRGPRRRTRRHGVAARVAMDAEVPVKVKRCSGCNSACGGRRRGALGGGALRRSRRLGLGNWEELKPSVWFLGCHGSSVPGKQEPIGSFHW